MRLAVEGTGYQGAVEAYVTGNHLAADACESLARALAGYAGMAGDDTTAAEFASSYDEAAAESLAALGELTFGFASLGHLTAASLHNHAWAETVTGPPTLADRAVGVRPAAPPSSLGGDSSALPGWANAVLDLLEGVFWPSADTDRLRAAAASWRTAATSVGLLSAHCATALGALSDEVSPEIPLAVATTDDLRGRIDALAEQLVAVGAACETYADQVDAKRAEMLDLLEQLAWELGIGAVVSGALEFLTGGAATPAVGAAGATRLAAASARVRGILESLGALSRGTATTLRPVAATVRHSREYLSRLAAARRMYVTEQGSIQLGRSANWRAGWLSRHESAGGHTLLKHVGKSDDELLRLLATSKRRVWSSFSNQGRAERFISETIARHDKRISAWLSGPDGRLRIDDMMSTVTGRTASQGGTIDFVSGIRVILVRDQSMPDGFRVLTAFPQP